ncbi:hypothetical protein EJ06DRAFT_427107 [Trichodelitschia bisporula]|uniref:Uncharacterized protein n=1 Tax=Trichodelitschia bisporula TaxID=703511 RepID=A0A6G1HWY2_9PEZI|nr:hypothetical protein EJ06DRAFT_427107 [Trichodelitschia bisporula]
MRGSGGHHTRLRTKGGRRGRDRAAFFIQRCGLSFTALLLSCELSGEGLASLRMLWIFALIPGLGDIPRESGEYSYRAGPWVARRSLCALTFRGDI